MKDAGLTNGAFYAHFESKEELVATAVTDQLSGQREWLASFVPGREGVDQIVRAYLSPQHRDNPEDGCPSAALLDEIGRCAEPTKLAYTQCRSVSALQLVRCLAVGLGSALTAVNGPVGSSYVLDDHELVVLAGAQSAMRAQTWRSGWPLECATRASSRATARTLA